MPESWAASHLVATCSLGLKASALEATGGCSTPEQGVTQIEEDMMIRIQGPQDRREERGFSE